MAYNYNNQIIEQEFGSYPDKILDIHTSWDDEEIENKRVKIIYKPTSDEKIDFETKINSYIEKNKKKIKIHDIKYSNDSVLIIFEQKT